MNLYEEIILRWHGMGNRIVGLKSYFVSAAVCMVFLVSLIAVGLFQSANLLTKTTVDMSHSAQSLYLVQDIRKELNIFRRQSLMSQLKAPWQMAETQKSAEESILETLDRLGSSAAFPGLHRRLTKSLSAYFYQWRELSERSVNGADLFAGTIDSYEKVLSSIENLLDAYVLSSKASEARAFAASQIYERNALWTVTGIIALIAFSGWVFIRHLYLPIMSLTNSIRRFPREKLQRRESKISEIAEISKSFEDLGNRLQTMNEERLTFLSSVAHDLKNPLGAIQMSVQSLSEEVRHPDHRHLLEIIGRQTVQLNRLIADLLDGTRVGTGRFNLNLKVCDLRNIVADSAILFKSLSSDHKIRLHLCRHPVNTSCDPERIGQILNNLVGNAIKYSPGGGVVEISVDSDEKNAIISIVDQGMGIEASELEKVFDPFHRSAGNIGIPGLGLGLATARSLVERHKGQISVDSNPGAGTIFKVSLPLWTEPIAPLLGPA